MFRSLILIQFTVCIPLHNIQKLGESTNEYAEAVQEVKENIGGEKPIWPGNILLTQQNLT